MMPVVTNPALLLRLFVYGTLRRGGRFHERYCKGVLSIDAASARGRVQQLPLPERYLVLVVPEETILARGTADAAADAHRQASVVAEGKAPDPSWSDVPGELLTFDDPQTRLPRIDKLEGFRPGAESLSRRVLIPIRCVTGSSVAAWAYVEGELARRPSSM
jgi:gamma-glutamylcyclotransferase (GGCT)/AIG2-like uncharacterized protein YtfP